MASRPRSASSSSAQSQDPVADPSLTRKGLLSHPGSLATAAAAVLFALYVFNVGSMGTWADALFTGVAHKTQSQNEAVVHFTFTAVPYIAAGLIFLVILCLFRWAAGALSRTRIRARLAGRRSFNAQEFSDFAGAHFISAKVASATWRGIQPFYFGDVRAKLDDDLRRTLGLSDSLVDGLIVRVLHLSDRRATRSTNTARIVTLFDLMKHVEDASPLFLTDSEARRARGEEGAPKPIVLPPSLTETRTVMPLHKRIEQAQKEASRARVESAQFLPVRPHLPPKPSFKKLQPEPIPTPKVERPSLPTLPARPHLQKPALLPVAARPAARPAEQPGPQQAAPVPLPPVVKAPAPVVTPVPSSVAKADPLPTLPVRPHLPQKPAVVPQAVADPKNDPTVLQPLHKRF